MTKLLFSVTATETVIARYLPMIVEAADRDTAEAMVEAMRCDGDRDLPNRPDRRRSPRCLRGLHRRHRSR